MKRHPALQDLSREHHDALKIARHGRLAALSGDAAAVAAYGAHVARSFDSEMEPHFREEESELLPFLAAAGENDLVWRTLAEHAELRALAAALRQAEAATLLRFADLLAAHVRFEERELFEAAQAHGFGDTGNAAAAPRSVAATAPPVAATACC